MRCVHGVRRVAIAALMLAAAATHAAGDATRGAAIAGNRSQGLCVLCHALPGLPAVLTGTIGPSLAGTGARLSPDELRGRLLTPERFNAATVMPAYGRSEGLSRVASARRGQALLDAQQIDDVVAYLVSLK